MSEMCEGLQTSGLNNKQHVAVTKNDIYVEELKSQHRTQNISLICASAALDMQKLTSHPKFKSQGWGTLDSVVPQQGPQLLRLAAR